MTLNVERLFLCRHAGSQASFCYTYSQGSMDTVIVLDVDPGAVLWCLGLGTMFSRKAVPDSGQNTTFQPISFTFNIEHETSPRTGITYSTTVWSVTPCVTTEGI